MEMPNLKLLSVEVPAHLEALTQSFFDALARNEYRACSQIMQQLWKAGLPSTAIKAIISATNEYLAPKELEWTSHGIFRSFRFWTRPEKVSYLSMANQVLAVLTEKANAQACAAYGTALAIARDNDLIPHDDDIDLLAMIPSDGAATTYPAVAESLIKPLQAAGFNARVVEPHLIHVSVGGTKLDVFSAVVEEGYVTSFPGPRKQIRADELFPAVPYEILGVSVPVPRQLESYLTHVYGKDWRTPQPSFSHNWSKSHHAGLF